VVEVPAVVVLVRISSLLISLLAHFFPKIASNCALDLFIVTLVSSILRPSPALSLNSLRFVLGTCLKIGNSFHLQAVDEDMELKDIIIQHLSKDPERQTRVVEGVNEGMGRRC
jgi:hypothetical protein